MLAIGFRSTFFRVAILDLINSSSQLMEIIWAHSLFLPPTRLHLPSIWQSNRRISNGRVGRGSMWVQQLLFYVCIRVPKAILCVHRGERERERNIARCSTTIITCNWKFIARKECNKVAATAAAAAAVVSWAQLSPAKPHSLVCLSPILPEEFFIYLGLRVLFWQFMTLSNVSSDEFLLCQNLNRKN